jgi:RNA polymerase sigma-70 factor (ECF subfamily)
MSSSDDLLATRRSLLGRLADWGDHESWQEFFNTYWRLIYNVATKSGLSDAEAQDVVQETVLTVAKKIGDFKSHPALGSFKGWLLTITRRRIADQFEKRAKVGVQLSAASNVASTSDPPKHRLGSEDTNRTSTVERVPDPASLVLEDCWEEQWQQHVLNAAIERVKNRVSPKQFQMFELYVLREWPVGKVAKTLGTNSGQVYLAKHRISSLLKRERERLEAQM